MHRLKAAREIRAHRAVDHVKLRVAWLRHAEAHVGPDEGRTDVERVASETWDPFLVCLDQAFDALEELVAVKLGQADCGCTFLQPFHVVFGAEHQDLVFGVLVGLHPLEALVAVVEDCGRWVHDELVVWVYLGGSPAGYLGPVNFEHVVSKGSAE